MTQYVLHEMYRENIWYITDANEINKIIRGGPTPSHSSSYQRLAAKKALIGTTHVAYLSKNEFQETQVR